MCVIVGMCVSLLTRVFVHSCLVFFFFFFVVCAGVGLRILLAGSL